MIEQRLKKYKENKTTVATTNVRIEALKKLLQEPNLEEYTIYPSGIELGMPRAPFRVHSGVETAVLGMELTAEKIKQCIEEEKSRIFLLQMEIEQIELCLYGNGNTRPHLTRQEVYLLECRYFEKMLWKDVKSGYSQIFREYPDERALMYRTKHAIEKLEQMLQPFYSVYGVA